MHVSRIRSKLNLRSDNGYRLQTVFGYGYRLESF
jgi:DNA-binding response OmpR family regulator